MTTYWVSLVLQVQADDAVQAADTMWKLAHAKDRTFVLLRVEEDEPDNHESVIFVEVPTKRKR